MTTLRMYMSFCDPARPRGSQFLGCAIVEIDDPGDGLGDAERVRAVVFLAMQKAWRVGCNPGGEVQTTLLPEASAAIPDKYLNRLLTVAEMEEAGTFVPKAKPRPRRASKQTPSTP